jgi:hypothetical protein
LTEELGEAEVSVLGHGVEFLLVAQGDDSNSAAYLEGNDLLGIESGHGGDVWRCWLWLGNRGGNGMGMSISFWWRWLERW